MTFWLQCKNYHSRKCIRNCCMQNGNHFVKTLTHWSRVRQICISRQATIGLDNGLPPGRRQAITWTNAGILLIGPLGTNFSEILIEIHIHFHSRKCIWKCRLENVSHFVSGLNVFCHFMPVLVQISTLSTDSVAKRCAYAYKCKVGLTSTNLIVQSEGNNM